MNNLTLKNLVFLIALISLNIGVSAVSFDELSKSFVVMQSASGKKYLCAAVKMDGATYAVTSQSLFMNPIPKFRLKSFLGGKNLKQAGCDVAILGDFVRIKLEENSDITPLEKGSGGGKKVYSMDPNTGIIYSANAGGGNLSNKEFKCTAGSPIISNDGKFIGVASRTDDGFGRKGPELKVAALGGEKWHAEKAGLIAKQVYCLPKWIKFTKALEKTHSNMGKRRLIEINENTHPKLIALYKDQNNYVFERSFGKKSKNKGGMGKAVREHEARCFQYTNMKRLAAFYSSNAQMAKKARWKSAYLRKLGKKVFDENNSRAKALRKGMKSMVEMYPATKAKY